jgi:hypothetical protein
MNKAIRLQTALSVKNTATMWKNTHSFGMPYACSTSGQVDQDIVNGKLHYPYEGSVLVLGKTVHFYTRNRRNGDSEDHDASDEDDGDTGVKGDAEFDVMERGDRDNLKPSTDADAHGGARSEGNHPESGSPLFEASTADEIDSNDSIYYRLFMSMQNDGKHEAGEVQGAPMAGASPALAGEVGSTHMDVDIENAVARTENPPMVSVTNEAEADQSAKHEAGEVQGAPMADASPAHGGKVEDSHSDETCCGICSSQSATPRICPTCLNNICDACTGFSSGLIKAARQFIEGNVNPPACNKLKCLRCQPVEEYDAFLTELFDTAAEAVVASLQQKKDAVAQRNLWYHVGLSFVEAGNSGVVLPTSFVTAAVQMLEHELQVKCRGKDQLPSVSPWDGIVLGLSPDMILKISAAYAGQLQLKPAGRLREYYGGDFEVAFVSADMVDHSTAHLVSAELIAMSKMIQDGVIVWVVCVAKPERIDSMNSNSPYRRALKQNFGERFLELGNCSVSKMAAKLKDVNVNPHAILLAGFHQDGDRPKVLDLFPHSIVVQTTAHAGPTGCSKRVDYVLANRTAIPSEIAHFNDKVQIIDAPFLGNSFRLFFSEHAEKLHQVRTDHVVRSNLREKLRLSPARKLLLNISSPNQLKSDYFDMIFQVLSANPDTDLVLVSHVKSFDIRMQARFKAKGLENRLRFVQFQNLDDGSLHNLIGAVDLYVNNRGYPGHTASHDALWSARVVISLQGDTTLAGMIVADLHDAFGTPENLLKTDAAAIERINQLLQSPAAYAEACLKSDLCRKQSRMYDSELRGRLVISALKEAHATKVEEQKQREIVRADNALLADSDLTEIVERLQAICVEVTGPMIRDEHLVQLQAEWRGMSVNVLLSARLNCDAIHDPVLIEAQVRDFISIEFGSHSWTRGLPFNERDVKEGVSQLDVISLTVRQHTVHALLLEQPISTAASYFESMAHDWQVCKGRPSESLLDRTIIGLRAQLQLLACVHGRKRSWGGDPLFHLHLSPLIDGHFKKAVAKILDSDNRPCAIMLGRGTYMQDSTRNHHPGCRHAKAEGVCGRPRQMDLTGAARASPRFVARAASFPSSEVKDMLASLPRLPPPPNLIDGKCPGCGGFASIELSQRQDLRRAAQVIMNALVGQSDGPTVVERIGAPGEGWGALCSGAELYKIFLSGLDEGTFRDSTGLMDRDTNPVDMFSMMRKRFPKFADLLNLLAKMFGSTPLETRRVLGDEQLFLSIADPSNELPQGLESAPEDRRSSLQACAPLMKALSEKTLHYYVEGKPELIWGRGQSAVVKKMIAVWLVYKCNPEKADIYYRSVRAAESGKVGEFAAIYSGRVERESTNIIFLDICYTLRFPNVGESPNLDGKGRGLMDAPRRVKESRTGMYLNSVKDKTGRTIQQPNCMRLWDPDWRTFGSSKRHCSVPDDARMGLVLSENVKQYDELVYSYDWAKSEIECGKAPNSKAPSDTKILNRLSKSGGNR